MYVVPQSSLNFVTVSYSFILKSKYRISIFLIQISCGTKSYTTNTTILDLSYKIIRGLYIGSILDGGGNLVY